MQTQAAKRHLTAISCYAGLIQMIDDNTGCIIAYLQRGVKNLKPNEVNLALRKGVLVKNYKSYQELPKNIVPHYECREMGRLYVTYSLERELKNLNKQG